MRKDVLSPFPYFGGKATLSPLICKLLDYDTTHTYVEPFGGAARVLLNKARHEREIYSEASESLYTFMRVLSEPDQAGELIELLHSDTTFSRECFEAAHELCNQIDHSRVIGREYRYWKKRLCALMEREFGIHLEIIDPVTPSDENAHLDFNDKRNISAEAQIARLRIDISDYVDDFNVVFDDVEPIPCSKEVKEAKKQFELLYRAILGLEDYSVTPAEWDGHPASDVEIAAAVYVMYAQSRDGMGDAFSVGKYRSQEAYYKRMNRLYDVAERMTGVEVWSTQAVMYWVDTAQDRWFREQNASIGLFQDPAVMAYLDPPYLGERDLEPLKDLGTPYRFRMDKDDHEQFLKHVVKARCKVLISNYDNQLYSDYLHDWTRIDIPVKTSVGGKKNNQRVEVLWYNY